MKNYKMSRIMMALVLFLSSFIAYSQSFEIKNSNRSNLELSLKIDEFALEDSNIEGVEG